MADTIQGSETARIARLGEALYRKIDVSAFAHGTYIAIDLASGEYVHGATDLEALDKAEARFGNAPGYLRRVGDVLRIGAGARA